jgi:hypothetical protein
MSQDASSPVSAAYEDTWRQIDDVVQQVTQQSRAPVSSEQFFTDLLDGCVRTLAAVGGAVWLRNSEGLRLEYQTNLARTGIVSSPNADAGDAVQQSRLQHDRLLNAVAARKVSRAVAPQSGSVHSDDHTHAELPGNPTDFLLLVCPLTIEDRVLGVLELFQRPDVSPAACQGFLRFLSAIAELAVDFLRNSELRELQDRATLWIEFERFTESVHQGLDVDQIAGSIANDGRQLIGCDRVCVALRRGSKYRTIAVSGLNSIDRRSDVIRAAEELIRRVMPLREAFWYLDTAEDESPSRMRDLPPQLDDALHGYLDVSPARVLAVLPLTSDSQKPPVGALIVERFEAVENPELVKHRTEVVARQSASALANATEYSSLPFLSVLRMIGRFGWYLRWRQLPRTIFIVAALTGAFAALILVPADFTVDGTGELQPAVRRGLFARMDGVVATLAPGLRSQETRRVEAGETLIELSNSDLDFELTRVLGELRTARQGIATTETERNNIDENDPKAESESVRLAVRLRELEESVKSLDAQLNVLKLQQDELKLTSPINGQILTWNAAQLLENRPVQRGDRLLQIAEIDGAWQLEIQVPDKNIGYVNDARREIKPDLDVSFVLATDPKVVFHGVVTKVASDTRQHGEDGPTVEVIVEIDRSAVPAAQLRPGATVIPHIECGQRPIGFVWFHELIHTIRTRVLF